MSHEMVTAWVIGGVCGAAMGSVVASAYLLNSRLSDIAATLRAIEHQMRLRGNRP